MRPQLLYFNSLSVPLKIVPRATLGTRAVGLSTPGVDDNTEMHLLEISWDDVDWIHWDWYVNR